MEDKADFLHLIEKIREWQNMTRREVSAMHEVIDELRDRDYRRAGHIGNLDCRLSKLESLLDAFTEGWARDKDKHRRWK